MRLRNRHDWRHFSLYSLNDGEGIRFMLALAGFVLFLGALVIMLWASSATTSRDVTTSDRQHFMDAVTTVGQDLAPEAQVEARKAFARQMLTMHDNELLTTNDSAIIDAAKSISDTGQPVELDTAGYDGFSMFWSVYRWLVWGSIVAIMSTVFGVYVFCAYEEDEYLMDFEWHRIWPILFVLLTPIGWPFYLVSIVRVRAKRRQVAAEDTPHNGGTVQAQTAGSYRFVEAPVAALHAFLALRTSVTKEARQNMLNHLNVRREHVQQQLRHYGQLLTQAQHELNEVSAEIKQREGIDIEEALPSQEELVSEFDRLLTLEGVAGVRVVNDGLSILVKPRLPYKGKTYDLGDFDLRILPSGHWHADELRDGTKSSWRGSYPVYRMGNSFCFGRRANIIDEHIKKGQILEGVEVAVNCMQSVNDDDLERVPLAFKEAK